MRLPLLCLLACAAFPAALAAQSNAERIVNDRYTRSHDFDLVHQRIELRDFDWDSTSFSGRVTTTLVSLRPGLDSVVLDAGALLDVRAARDARGAPLGTSRAGDTLIVRLPRPAAFHDTVRFVLDYRGRVRNGRGLTFIQPDGRPHRPRQIWSQGEAMENHFWFPTYDFPNDKMTWDLAVTIPREYTVVSNGRLVSDRPAGGGQHTVTWSQARPASTYLVSLVIAPLARLHDHWHAVPVDYYVYHEDSALARAVFRETPDMIDVYSRLTGLPYPWAKYAQTTVADFFGGMENVSATTVVDWLPDARALRDRAWYQYLLVPHELAHQWFGDYVTTENWANLWLNEGFAEFMPGAYWTARRGRQAGDDYYLNEYRQFLAIDARHRMPLAAQGSDNIYPKGALVLRMLERYLGEQRFWASLHTYLARHALGNATSDDLRQAVLDATGENLDWFWDEWVYQAGYPRFTVTARYDSAAHALALQVAQTQTDSATADSTGLRFTTPAVFRMPVVVRVATAGGDVVHRAQLDARTQTITVPGLAGPPLMVVFDDGNTILKTLAFDEPTAWLARQLRVDPDLWNRSWVIDQLRGRTADSTALRALADAAQRADYPLTRAEAAAALGAFPSPGALPALAAAVRDTSPAVRTSAVTALAELGGSEALALVRTAWESDSSYDVEAAALPALARLDSANQRALLAAGLARASYRDVVRDAALRTIARTGDTTFVGPVSAMLGDSPLPALTLAALGTTDSSAALDSLSAHAGDERARVRGWVLRAFATMPAALAIPRLEAVRRSVPFADTRTQAGELITRLSRRSR